MNSDRVRRGSSFGRVLRRSGEKDIRAMVYCGGCASARERCGSGMEKIYPTTAVRYGRMNFIGEFSHDADMKFTCGGKVVIQTDRGIEIGQQVSLTCYGCDKSVTREQMRAFAKASGGDSYRLNSGRILREATAGDLAEVRHLDQEIFDKIGICRRMASGLDLPMKIVDAEHIFGGERIIFYFMSEDRVDFRELVRQLAREFQTRIEMRQVGARDEARLLADYETCGRECCCKNFLKSLKPVGMQMAKLQKATLDPSKVSGRCGRLKCCLRYEHESYNELNKKLPRVGRRVRTAGDEGVVIDRQIITQLLRLRKDDGTIVTVCEEDILERDLPAPPPQAEGDTASPSPRRGGRPRSERPRQQADHRRSADDSNADGAPGEQGGRERGDRERDERERGERGRRSRAGRRRRSRDESQSTRQAEETAPASGSSDRGDAGLGRAVQGQDGSDQDGSDQDGTAGDGSTGGGTAQDEAALNEIAQNRAGQHATAHEQPARDGVEPKAAAPDAAGPNAAGSDAADKSADTVDDFGDGLLNDSGAGEPSGGDDRQSSAPPHGEEGDKGSRRSRSQGRRRGRGRRRRKRDGGQGGGSSGGAG